MTMSDGRVILPRRWRMDTISRPEHMIRIASTSVKSISLLLDKNSVYETFLLWYGVVSCFIRYCMYCIQDYSTIYSYSVLHASRLACIRYSPIRFKNNM